MKGFSRSGMVWKKKLCSAFIISLLIGGTCLLQGEAAPSPQTESENGLETEASEEETEKSDSVALETETSEPEETVGSVSGSDIPETEPSDQEDVQTEILESNDAEEIVCLQLPEKLEIVIDPWEIDGKGQIHSEPFIVKNTGGALGFLTLSFICRVNEKDGVDIKETRDGLHNSNQKLIYMKAVLGNGEETTFTKEGAQCQAQIQPGEELTLRFEGEVNENAAEPWKSGDVEIEGVYIWEEQAIGSEEDEEDVTEVKEENDFLSDETDTDVSDEGEILPDGPDKEASEKEENPSTESAEKETTDGEKIPSDGPEKETSDGKDTPTTEPEKEDTDEKEVPSTELEKEDTDGKEVPSTEPEKEETDEKEVPSTEPEKEDTDGKEIPSTELEKEDTDGKEIPSTELEKETASEGGIPSIDSEKNTSNLLEDSLGGGIKETDE